MSNYEFMKSSVYINPEDKLQKPYLIYSVMISKHVEGLTNINFLQACEYCNKLSEKEKLSPFYEIIKKKQTRDNFEDEDAQKERYECGNYFSITPNMKANGYRLPTACEIKKLYEIDNLNLDSTFSEWVWNDCFEVYYCRAKEKKYWYCDTLEEAYWTADECFVIHKKKNEENVLTCRSTRPINCFDKITFRLCRNNIEDNEIAWDEYNEARKKYEQLNEIRIKEKREKEAACKKADKIKTQLKKEEENKKIEKVKDSSFIVAYSYSEGKDCLVIKGHKNNFVEEVDIPLEINGVIVKYIDKSLFSSLPNVRKVFIPETVIKLDVDSLSRVEDIQVKGHNPVYSVYDGILYENKKAILLFNKKDSYELDPEIEFIDKSFFKSYKNIKSLSISNSNTKYIVFDGILYENEKPFYIVEEKDSYEIPIFVKEFEHDVFSKLNKQKITIKCYFESTIHNWCKEVGFKYRFIDNIDYDYEDVGNGIKLTKCCFDPAGVVVIPSSVKGKIVIALGKGLFANCIKVVEYKLPEMIETIESQCFASNAMLEKINIPESCKKIDDYAFSLCKKLCEVEMGGKPEIGKFAFIGCNWQMA